VVERSSGVALVGVASWSLAGLALVGVPSSLSLCSAKLKVHRESPTSCSPALELVRSQPLETPFLEPLLSESVNLSP
jgi:hypothetical protein